MLTHFGIANLNPDWEHSVVCIGTFDGVHLGHRHVISQAVSLAQSRQLPSALLTFDRHPASTLHPDRVPPLVSTLEQNLRVIRSLGTSISLILPFNNDLSQMSPEAFCSLFLDQALKASAVVVGHDFGFGKDRAGTPEWLASRYETVVVPPFSQQGTRISSSAIRQAVASGDMETARKLLGRDFALAGVVVTGQRLGRTLGFPTANLVRSCAQVVPSDGIYACRVHLDGVIYKAATSIGLRPTVGGTHRTIETHLLNYSGPEFYGKAMDIEFVKRLRDEEKYDSLEELKSAIAEDCRKTAETVSLVSAL